MSGGDSIRDAQAGRDIQIKHVEKEIHVHQGPQAPLHPLHQLPSLTEHFTGRTDEIVQLCRNVRERAHTGRPVAIVSSVHGQGGIGKTELAIATAYELRGDFPEAQIVLRLGAHSAKPSSPETVRDALLLALNPEARLPNEEAARWAAYQQVFQHPDGRPLRAILILDDVADDAQVRALLSPPGCAVLITSRRKLASGDALELKTLPPADAVSLLRSFRPGLSEAEAGELARLCGRLTVALQCIGGFLRQNASKPVAEYLNELRSDPLARLRHREDETLDVNVIFARSLRDLTPAQQAAFRALSVCTADFDRNAGKAIGACTGDDVDELQALHLLKFDESRGRFSWDDLVQAFALLQLRSAKTEEFEARLRHVRHYAGVGEEADQLYLQGGENVLRGLGLFDRERPHLEAAFEFLVGAVLTPRSAALSSGPAGALGGIPSAAAGSLTTPALLVSLVNAVVHTGLDLRFHPRQCIRWLEAQRDAARITRDRKAEGNALGNLGLAYADLGDAHKAIEFHQEALVIDREIGDRRGEGQGLGNLGLAYAVLGDACKAIEFYEPALVIAREMGDRRGEGNALGNLGLAYAALGDARRAIEFYEQRLVIAREIGDQRGEGNALGNLGNAYASLGEVRKAIEFHEQALVIDREIGDRRGEGADLGNLGLAYKNLGDARKAIEFYEQQLGIVREIGDRRGARNALGNLGSAYYILGDARKAVEFCEQALVIAREIGDRRGEGNALGNLGSACYSLGEARKAIEFYEQQLRIVREIGDRCGEGNALFNSALALDKLGDRAEAFARAEAALRIYEAVEDPHAAMVRATLARWRAAKPE